MITIQNMLMGGQPGWETIVPGTGMTYCPIIDTEAAVDTTVMLTIDALVGNPTEASLKVIFESCQQTTNTAGTASNVTDNGPVYFDITDTNLVVPAKAYGAPLVTQALVGKPTFIWTVKGGFRWRIGLEQAFTGGAAPAFIMSASMVTRY